MKITIEIDKDRLSSYSDEFLANAWHVAQANPAPEDDDDAGDLVEHIAREIVRRWLKQAPVSVWNHQGRSHYWSILAAHGRWEVPPGGTEADRKWVYGNPAMPAKGNP